MMDTQTKPTNPKDAIGSNKLPLHLWPATATAMGSVGFLNGLLKYGRANFRAIGIRASVYVDAAERHLKAWFEGEEFDPDDDVPHLAAALACIAIIVDARAAGKMVDDRQVAGGYRALVDELTPHVARLKALHAAHDPKHYTIADSAMVADNDNRRPDVPRCRLVGSEAMPLCEGGCARDGECKGAAAHA